MRSRFDLSGTRVLLTGATGGIGHEIARVLHGRGARLMLSGRRLDVLEPLASELGAQAVAADLSSPEEVSRLADEAGDAEVLVANAAVPASGPALDFSVEQIDAVLATNLRAPIVLARLIGERMRQRGRGRIVFVGSLAGLVASPAGSLYSATKFGLRGFATGMRQDLHGSGVGVSIVEPGFVDEAGMFAGSGVKLPRGMGTVSPRAVADAVVTAVERDRAEIVVAPLGLSLGARIGSVAPGLAGIAQRFPGAQRTAAAMTAGQRHMW